MHHKASLMLLVVFSYGGKKSSIKNDQQMMHVSDSEKIFKKFDQKWMIHVSIWMIWMHRAHKESPIIGNRKRRGDKDVRISFTESNDPKKI